MDKRNALAELAALLEGGARILVRPERLVPSTIYDLQYRLTVIACAFARHATVDVLGNLRMQPARLKLYQFVAARPWLVPTVQGWSRHRSEPQLSLLSSQGLRRGFLSDQMHDDVVAFLVARNVLMHSQQYLSSGPAFEFLGAVYRTVIDQEMFVPEREALDQLDSIKVTNHMLEGW